MISYDIYVEYLLFELYRYLYYIVQVEFLIEDSYMKRNIYGIAEMRKFTCFGWIHTCTSLR